MKDIGSDPSYLRRVEQPDALYGMLQDVADQALQPITFTQFALVDLLPDFMSYVPDSAAPPLARTGQNGQRLEWNERPVDATGVTYTLMLEPLQTGHLATSLETSGVYKDSMDCTGTLTFTVPQVDVRAPTAVPTSLPTQTPTQPPPASPTTSPVPTATITPTLTATPVVRPVFLPVAVRERCVPEQKRVDVALAIDASTSMVLERTSAGQTKLAAAVDAARSFLDVLRLGSGDQASIVAFNDSAMLLTRLTGDRAVLDRALGSIEAAEHTCLVCAVDVAATELAGDRRNTANTPILILLTDGWSNPRPASEAVERATLAKSAGVVIFTIGLGATVDDVSLTAIASRPSYYYRAPTADQLKDIYRQIAVTIPCPPQAFWPRR